MPQRHGVSQKRAAKNRISLQGICLQIFTSPAVRVSHIVTRQPQRSNRWHTRITCGFASASHSQQLPLPTRTARAPDPGARLPRPSAHHRGRGWDQLGPPPGIQPCSFGTTGSYSAPARSSSSIIIIGRSIRRRALPGAKLDADPEGRDRGIGDEWDLVIGLEEWRHFEVEAVGAFFRADPAFGDQQGTIVHSLALKVDYNF